MVPDLVRQHVRLGEFAGGAEPVRQIVVKSEVDIDLLVGRTIKRSRGRLGKTTGRVRRIAEQYQLRVPVRYVALLWQKAIPGFLGIIKHEGNKLHEVGFRRVLNGAARSLVDRRSCFLSSGEHRNEIAFEDDAEQNQQKRCAYTKMRSAYAASTCGPAILDITTYSPRSPPHIYSSSQNSPVCVMASRTIISEASRKVSRSE